MASAPRIPEIASSDSSRVEVDTPSNIAPMPVPVQDQRRLQWFKRAERWFNRFVRLASAVHEGFWLGCLSADELNAITAGHYQQSQEYASQAHNQRGLFDWERAVLDRYFPPGSRILVAAAGGGREILGLRRAGYQAEGFECSPTLLEASQALFDRLGEPRGSLRAHPMKCLRDLRCMRVSSSDGPHIRTFPRVVDESLFCKICGNALCPARPFSFRFSREKKIRVTRISSTARPVCPAQCSEDGRRIRARRSSGLVLQPHLHARGSGSRAGSSRISAGVFQ